VNAEVTTLLHRHAAIMKGWAAIGAVPAAQLGSMSSLASSVHGVQVLQDHASSQSFTLSTSKQTIIQAFRVCSSASVPRLCCFNATLVACG